MRRSQALLIAAGLAAAPSSAIAGPSNDSGMVMSLVPAPRTHLGAAEIRGGQVAQARPSFMR